MLTKPEPIFSEPIKTTLAALTIASAASIAATKPRVSIIPNASMCTLSFFTVLTGVSAGAFAGAFAGAAAAVAGFLAAVVVLPVEEEPAVVFVCAIIYLPFLFHQPT